MALMRLNFEVIHQLSMLMFIRQLKYAILKRILYDGGKELAQSESNSSILYDGAKDLAQSESNSSKYEISPENKEIGEKLSEIGSRLDYPLLTNELANEIKILWQDAAIQETYSHGNILQVPDCAQYFMENLERLSEVDYVPTKVAVCLLDQYSLLHHFTLLYLSDHYIQTLKLLVHVAKNLY